VNVKYFGGKPVPYSVDFEVALDILATYLGYLENTTMLLEKKPDVNADELEAWKKEEAKIGTELHEMSPDDRDLVNRAKYIYVHLIKALEDNYLL